MAAARSLILRHWNADRSLSDLKSLGLDRNFINLAHDSINVRSRLQSDSVDRVTLGMRFFDDRIWQGLQVAKGLICNRLPNINRRSRKTKVAVCISGQLRGYVSAFHSWRRTILRDVEYELFVDTWQRIGRSGAEPFRFVLPFEGERFSEKYREACLQAGLDEFKIRYPAIFDALAVSGRVTDVELSKFYDTPHIRLDDDDQPPFAAFSNQEKMHSKIQSCFEMAMASGKEYDLIIRLRPDKPIRFLGYKWSDIRRLCQASPTLYADAAGGVHYANLMIGDQFAIGAPKPMQVYSTTWSTFRRFAGSNLLKCPRAFEGHVSLAQICWLHSINVKRVPIGFEPLQEPERLPSKRILNCLTKDAANRMDRIDRLLLEAVSADLRG
jgi:hypothetical protein